MTGPSVNEISSSIVSNSLPRRVLPHPEGPRNLSLDIPLKTKMIEQTRSPLRKGTDRAATMLNYHHNVLDKNP